MLKFFKVDSGWLSMFYHSSAGKKSFWKCQSDYNNIVPLCYYCVFW